jgi:hypothetical protein
LDLEFEVNREVAKAFGITIQQSLLRRADEVIQYTGSGRPLLADLGLKSAATLHSVPACSESDTIARPYASLGYASPRIQAEVHPADTSGPRKIRPKGEAASGVMGSR